MKTNGLLKVGYVLKRYPRFSETFIVNEILALEKQGVEVEIFALKPPIEGVFHENLARVKARVNYLPQRGQKASYLLRAMANTASLGGFDQMSSMFDEEAIDLEHGLVVGKMAAERGIQVLHAHFATSATSVARIASRISNIPYTLTAHAKDIFHETVDPLILEKRLAGARKIVTVSEFNVNYLRTNFPTVANKVLRIYNGMPLEQFPSRQNESTSHRLLAVGRLVEKKGVSDLIEAVGRLKFTYDNVRCDIVGDGPLRASLEALTKEFDLQENVLFHGILPQHEVHAFMVDADVFVAPCIVSTDGDRDGLPTVLLEAMAIGTPCVSTPVTGIPEVITHKQTGLLVPERDPAAIAHACSTLFENEVMRSDLTKKASDVIRTKFDIDKNTKALVNEWLSISKRQNYQGAVA